MRPESGIWKVQDDLSKLHHDLLKVEIDESKLQSALSKLQDADSDLQNYQLKLHNGLLKLQNNVLESMPHDRNCAYGSRLRCLGPQNARSRDRASDDHSALGGMDQLQSRISSLDPFGATNILTKRDAMNGQACPQIA